MTKEYFYCPKCKSTNINSGRFDDEIYCREVYCDDCGFEWLEQFAIVGNYDEHGEELGDPE